MGGFAAVFKGLVGGDPIKSIGDLIDQFHLSPEQKAQMQQAAQELEVQRDQIEAARDEALAQVAEQTQKDWESSPDPFVRRAPAFFIWGMGFALVLNLLIPNINRLFGGHMEMIAVPEALYLLFGTVFGVHATASYGVWFQTDLPATDTNPYDITGFSLSAGYSDALILGDGTHLQLYMENSTGTSHVGPIGSAIVPNTAYWVTGFVTSGGKPEVAVYTDNTCSTQVGSTLTGSTNYGAFTDTNVTLAMLGDLPQTAGKHFRYSNFVFDPTGTFPLCPH